MFRTQKPKLINSFIFILKTRFFSKEGIRNHRKTSHLGKDKTPPLYLCQVCGKSFKSASGVTAHNILVHVNKNAENVRCEICKRSYKNKYGLKNHIILSHESTPQNCPTCGKTSQNPTALARHIRIVHENESFECEICHKILKSSQSFKVSETFSSCFVLLKPIF